MKFKIYRKESFDLAVCGRNYDCNKQAFEESLSRNPELYPNWKEIPSRRGEFHFELYDIIEAFDINDALDKVSKMENYELNWQILSEDGDVLKNHTEVSKAVIPSKFKFNEYIIDTL